MRLTRRRFLEKSLLAGAGAAALSMEEKILLAKTSERPAPAPSGRGAVPRGKIGKVIITRLICGGNLINGYAHSRELTYVSDLMKHYFTDEKIIETLEICERNGINALVANNNPGENTVRVLNKHRKRGGKIQWLAQVNPLVNDLWSNIQTAVDNGAVGAFLQGGIGDDWARSRPDLIAEAVAFIKRNGLVAGVAGHELNVPRVCEEKDVGADFYVKTLNSVGYYSSSPAETVKFMEGVSKPWIAYKILGAGAVPPSEGFRYAFESGADFICVGMFDFQIADDVKIARQVLRSSLNRRRDWYS